MTKTVVSVVALLLLFQGCNTSSSNGDSTVGVSSEIKSFAKSLTDNEGASKVVKKSASSSKDDKTTANKLYQKTRTDSCTDGGTQVITSNIDDTKDGDSFSEDMLNEFSMNIVTDKCIEDGFKSSGSMEMVVKKLTTIITFKEDSTFEDLETTEVFRVFKNSNIKIEEISENKEKITESIKATSSKGNNYETIDLVTYENYKDNSILSYEVSGSIVHSGETYRVDEKYDGSKTPMVFKNNEEEDLVSGTAKYFNDKNQHITVEVIDKNQLKISVDVDNDGDIDEEEIFSL